LSYRTFKHLVGETSLERKCRFIFGGGILALVSLSFCWYGQKTESLVIGQKTEGARLLVGPVLQKFHTKKLLVGQNTHDLIDEWADDHSSLNENPGYDSHLITPFQPRDEEHVPRDEFEGDAIARFLRAAAKEGPSAHQPMARRANAFLDGSPQSFWRIVPGRKEYQYVEAVLFKPSCIDCHKGLERIDPASGKHVFARPYDLAGAVVVKLPMDKTNKDINRNRAILISTAMVTALLAMLASWTIFRYIIAKPVKHLRDVSDAISAGKLNIRSQIHTGDEFEELSHAFNRMLHNLVAMQQELREVNSDLDKKVDELAQANLALFEMNRLKSDFLATMSHELRTPLNSIIGFSEVLSSNEGLSEKQRRYAANIQHSGKMLLGMINDILDLAKIESGKMEVKVEDFSIRDVCEGLTNLARPIAEKKSIDLQCRLDEAIPLMRQDPGKLRQILYNLLSNAIKFTPEGGRVTISARVEGRHVVLEVDDTGVGIAEEDRERVFEKFRQAGIGGAADGVLTREHAGTGLGLSIVRELAKLLGGDVALESELGRGSTFTVRLPMQLPGHRRFEVNLSDERIDLSKARRVDLRGGPGPHVPVGPGAAPPRRGPGDPPPPA
jgi:signal transduction histidine kinase